MKKMVKTKEGGAGSAPPSFVSLYRRHYPYFTHILPILMCMVCVWYVYGMCMVCVWHVYGMYMAEACLKRCKRTSPFSLSEGREV